jgi:hypothetical protein
VQPAPKAGARASHSPIVVMASESIGKHWCCDRESRRGQVAPRLLRPPVAARTYQPRSVDTPAEVTLTRGSMVQYRTSTARLVTMIITENSRTTPAITGKS